ncbi:endonuclease/exonuclease/phosphatase family protein [Pseudomonas syringae group genomosp. 3]|uniref:endonuclease/exonuclease/phosphatase family protein n=1 Tax=Pseudomonas syringae group genomosp. 3 TaxID=251701 RepID=UPI000EFF6D6A|nr:endonuclease/exonuclease/phosphatase family protein [Pseudomonas syringae group genomosp. 3]
MRNTRGMKRQRDGEEGAPEERMELRSQKRERKGGYQHIYSWNMQGASADATKLGELRIILGKATTYCVLLQECGNLGGWTKEYVEKNFPGFTYQLHEWEANDGDSGKGNMRCSLASFFKDTVLGQETIKPVSDRRRPIVVTNLPALRIANIHAPRENRAFLDEVITQVFKHHKNIPTILVGDFNIEPIILKNTIEERYKVMGDIDVEVVSSGFSTHVGNSPREIDFIVANKRLKAKASTPKFVGGSDHGLMEFVIEVPGR